VQRTHLIDGQTSLSVGQQIACAIDTSATVPVAVDIQVLAVAPAPPHQHITLIELAVVLHETERTPRAIIVRLMETLPVAAVLLLLADTFAQEASGGLLRADGSSRRTIGYWQGVLPSGPPMVRHQPETAYLAGTTQAPRIDPATHAHARVALRVARPHGAVCHPAS